MNAQQAAQMLSLEARQADLERWLEAVEALAQCREEEPCKAAAFYESASSVIATAEGVELLELLRLELSLAERCFLLALLSVFLEVWCCSQDCSPERWLANWEAAAEFVIPAGLAVLLDPSHIPAAQVQASWELLVAACRNSAD